MIIDNNTKQNVVWLFSKKSSVYFVNFSAFEHRA